MAKLLFYVSALSFIYTYAIYFSIVWALSKLRALHRQRPALDDGQAPYVSVLVSAYNEADVIEEKVRNFQELDYPVDRIELLIGTDGCTDDTPTVLRKLSVPGLRPMFFRKRRGKAAVLNDLVREARGEILVFSDANTLYEKHAVRRLVSRFSEDNVGGVCGNLRLVSNKESVPAVGEIGYWQFENRLKRMESRIRTVFGATGGIYAIRKELYRPLPTDRMVNDDFVVAMAVVEAGYDVVYEEHAVAYEHALHSIGQEYRRKVRIGAGNVYSMARFFHLLHPKHGFVSFGLFSHKYLRWVLPFLMLGLLISNAFLLDEFTYRLFFSAQLFLYLVSLLGFVSAVLGLQVRLFTYAFWFFLLNLGLLVGTVRYLLGIQRPTWSKGRE